MSIISQETFDKFTEEEKEWIIKEYNSDAGEGHSMLGKLFGKENLKPQFKIKTWKDVLNQTDIHDFVINHPDCDNKLKLKLEATYKIQNLIEHGYGGMMREEEWRNNHIVKFCVIADYSSKYQSCNYETDDDYHFIAFHTAQQRAEFMSYPENVKLVEQYYMINFS